MMETNINVSQQQPRSHLPIKPNVFIANNQINDRDKLLKLAELSPSKTNSHSINASKKRFIKRVINKTNGSSDYHHRKASPNSDLSFNPNIEHLVNHRNFNQSSSKIEFNNNNNFSQNSKISVTAKDLPNGINLSTKPPLNQFFRSLSPTALNSIDEDFCSSIKNNESSYPSRSSFNKIAQNERNFIKSEFSPSNFHDSFFHSTHQMPNIKSRLFQQPSKSFIDTGNRRLSSHRFQLSNSFEDSFEQNFPSFNLNKNREQNLYSRQQQSKSNEEENFFFNHFSFRSPHGISMSQTQNLQLNEIAKNNLQNLSSDSENIHTLVKSCSQNAITQNSNKNFSDFFRNSTSDYHSSFTSNSSSSGAGSTSENAFVDEFSDRVVKNLQTQSSDMLEALQNFHNKAFHFPHYKINTFLQGAEKKTEISPEVNNSDQYRRTANNSNDSKTLRYSNSLDLDLLENFFLRDSQKKTLYNITDRSDIQGIESSTEVNKSSSCDNLEETNLENRKTKIYENNLWSKNRDNLSNLLHLEEDKNLEENLITRFRKNFSLRLSNKQSPIPSMNTSRMSNSFVKFVELSENKKTDSLDLYSKLDINQNQINLLSYSENKSYDEPLSSTLGRKKPFTRKSLRASKKNSLIRTSRRSLSQPIGNKSTIEHRSSLKKSTENDEPKKLNQSFESENHENNNNNATKSSVNINYAEAIFDYTGSESEELSFNAGDLIDVTDTSSPCWWWGQIKSKDETKYGWFPASYVRLKVSQEETLDEEEEGENFLQQVVAIDDSSEKTPAKQMRMSITKMSSEQIRSKIIAEIIKSERDFAKNLKDIIDGYLYKCRERTDMFDETRISVIFGNIEELYEFQMKFLFDLEKAIDEENLSQSQIGNCFLKNEQGFSVYCEYCKNHLLAINELQTLYIDGKYVAFFEGCRLIQNMINISLDGFLLTPIQKICKYNLQLAELLEHTRKDHPDYEPVSNAYNCMRGVALLVNEKKRRFEFLEQLIAIEESFENWEGPSLLDTSSMLINSGELYRFTQSSKSKESTLFLFDHILVLAKKDHGILKKGTFIFKSRIELDHIDSLIILEDNTKDVDFNVVAKNSFKFYYKLKQKWFFFQAKSHEERERWIKAFKEERTTVEKDQQQGFLVTEQDKKSALIVHLNNLKPKRPKSSRKPLKKPDTVIAEIPLDLLTGGFGIDRNRAGSLPSYILNNTSSSSNFYKNRPGTMYKKNNRSNWFQLNKNKSQRFKRNT